MPSRPAAVISASNALWLSSVPEDPPARCLGNHLRRPRLLSRSRAQRQGFHHLSWSFSVSMAPIISGEKRASSTYSRK
jgi:hypothetical protein